MRNLGPTFQRVGVLGDEREQFGQQRLERHQVAARGRQEAVVESVALGPPAVLFRDQAHERAAAGRARRRAHERAQEAAVQRRDAQRVLDRGARVHDAQFQRGVARRRTDGPPDVARVADRARGDQRLDEREVRRLVGEQVRRAGARPLVVCGLAIAHQSGAAPLPERRRGAERKKRRQPRQHPVHQGHAIDARRRRHVQVQGAEHITPADVLEVVDQAGVTRLLGVLLQAPLGERVGSARDDREVVIGARADHAVAQRRERAARLAAAAADRRGDLDLRLQQLGGRALAHALAARPHQPARHACDRAPARRLDHEVLFFDAERVVVLARHAASPAPAPSLHGACELDVNFPSTFA